jgi:hypothetical protein
MCKGIVRVAMKMHSCFSKPRASTESRDIIGSLWSTICKELCILMA